MHEFSNKTFIEEFYNKISEQPNFKNVDFGIILKNNNLISSYIYSEDNKNNINDYTFIHENFLNDNFDSISNENIMFETDLNEITNLLESEENYIILLMRPIPLDSFLSAVNSGDRLPPKVTNFLPKPPAGLVFQSLEGDL